METHKVTAHRAVNHTVQIHRPQDKNAGPHPLRKLLQPLKRKNLSGLMGRLVVRKVFKDLSHATSAKIKMKTALSKIWVRREVFVRVKKKKTGSLGRLRTPC